MSRPAHSATPWRHLCTGPGALAALALLTPGPDVSPAPAAAAGPAPLTSLELPAPHALPGIATVPTAPPGPLRPRRG